MERIIRWIRTTWGVLLIVRLFVHSTPATEIQLNENTFYGSCQLPSKWHGIWHFVMDSSELTTVKISNTSIELRGICKNQWNDQYQFMEDLGNGEQCWRFMLFTEKHPNVIQFKETECLQYAIPQEQSYIYLADNPYITMFRANSPPEPCPVEGPFNFNYSSSDNLCWSHTSKADNCASNNRLRFTFESCPEIPSSNKWEDEIQCFANWHDKNTGKHYFAAKLINDEYDAQQYRCLYFEKLSFTTGVIGRSADASCRALDNLKIFYTTVNKFDGYCKSFPHWLIHDHHDHNRKRRWESLSDSLIVHDFHRHEWIVRRVGGDYDDNVSVSTCVQENDVVEDSFVEFVVHTVKGCENFHQCVRIYRRSDQVIEILEGASAPMSESICSNKNFVNSKYDTLLLESSAEKQCPDRGRYSIEGCNDQYSEMFFGCSLEHQFVIDYKCEEGYTGTYNCHGYWKENETNFLIVREQNTGKKRCFVYANNHEHLIMFDYRLHPCKRGIINGLNSHRVYNASKSNLCSPVVESQIGANGGAKTSNFVSILLSLAIFKLITTYLL